MAEDRQRIEYIPLPTLSFIANPEWVARIGPIESTYVCVAHPDNMFSLRDKPSWLLSKMFRMRRVEVKKLISILKGIKCLRIVSR